jgi:cellulose synthase operon protein C
VKRDGSAIAVALRLAIAKDGLGIELAERVSLRPLDVVELVVRLPNVRFPFDVTGGIAKFRHRRGELERIAVELDARRVARWAEPQLRGLVSVGPCTVTIVPRAFGATVTIVASPLAMGEAEMLHQFRSGEPGARGRVRGPSALAFEVALAGGANAELAIAVHTARGANLQAPATQLAIRALDTLLGAHGEHVKREGSRFVIPRAAERLARVLLPDAGVRAPNGLDVKLVGSGENDGVLFIAFTRGTAVPDLPQAVTLAHEAAFLTRDADDARLAGDLERARRLDLAAFERAPRHPQIARRIAEVDAQVGGRAEAAIAILRGGSGGAAPYLGTLLGDLLVEAGDNASAIAALLRDAERDPSPAVAALTYGRAAALASDPADALNWLDAAIARAPTVVELRWDRATRRLTQGRLGDARADFQELEAIAAGARDRYDVLRRAAAIHRARGLGQDAALLYERALLYRPDDPETIAGLGAAIAVEGRAPRGATLLARAIELANVRVPPLPTAWMELALARILGDSLGDRPAAIAHLRAVADDTPEAIEARGLEGRYRAALHDVPGASLAFARLRERAMSSETSPRVTAVVWLDEAARFEEERGEPLLAQAHLAAAHAITPSNAEIEARYRALSNRVGRAAGLAPSRPMPATTNDVHVAIAVHPDRDRGTLPAPTEGDEKVRERVTLPAPTAGDEKARARATLPAPPSNMAATTPEEDEARVEALTRTLQGDPTNDTVVDELIVRLTRLGRSMELLALLSARLEDAPADRREELLPRHREVLDRLETEARAAGRDGEADLFRMAREAAI